MPPAGVYSGNESLGRGGILVQRGHAPAKYIDDGIADRVCLQLHGQVAHRQAVINNGGGSGQVGQLLNELPVQKARAIVGAFDQRPGP